MAYIQKGEIRFHYEYTQSKKENSEVIILLHGLGLDIESWNYIVKPLAENYHILRFDLRGHGKTIDYAIKQVTWDLLYEDFIFIIKSLNIKTYHLLGHSGGGQLALEISFRESFNIKSMILLSTPIYYPNEVARDEINSRRALINESTFEIVTNQLAHKICYPITDEKISLLLDSYKRVSCKTYLQYFDLMADALIHFDLQRLKEIDIPVLILAGEHDPLYPPQLFLMVLNYFKKNRYLIVPNASNMPQLDQPKLLVQWINEFIIDLTKLPKTIDIPLHNHQKRMYKDLHHAITQLKKNLKKGLDIDFLINFSVHLNGKELVGKWNQRNAKQLLAYLIIKKSATREQMCEDIWGEYDLNRAKNQLRVSLAHLKKIFRNNNMELEKYIIVDRENIYLSDEVDSDYYKLLKIIKTIQTEISIPEKVKRLKNVIVDLTNNFFPGLYDDWIMEIRQNLELDLIDVIEKLVKALIDREDMMNAIYFLRFLIKLSPFELVYYDQLIDLYTKLGDTQEVEFIQRLKEKEILELDFKIPSYN